MKSHQFLIASYHKDMPWLYENLRSLALFASGYLPARVVVPTSDVGECWDVIRQAGSDAQPIAFDCPGPASGGFGRAQIAMMSGDLFCPDADVVHLIGSDCVATAPFTPAAFLCPQTALPVMPYTPYALVPPHARFWRDGTTAALGVQPEHEFMRRLPLLYPRELYPMVRQRVERFTGQPFRDYVLFNVNHVRNFSESNVLGAVAWRHAHHLYRWVDLSRESDPCLPSPITQHWSWDTRPPSEVLAAAGQTT
jgi:hypothetical protein